jgi:hypothetical protein
MVFNGEPFQGLNSRDVDVGKKFRWLLFTEVTYIPCCWRIAINNF